MLWALAVVPALLSKMSRRGRLGLAPWNATPARIAVLLIGTLALQLAVQLVGDELLPEPSEQSRMLARLITQSHGFMAVVVALGVTVVPGFCEELFFRGYVQSRLLQRWPDARALVLPTLVFVVGHGDLHRIGLVALLGGWLAFVAWRTETVWASILCHCWNNAIALVVVLVGSTDPLSRIDPGPGFYIVVGIAAAFTVACAVRIWRVPHQPVGVVRGDRAHG